MKFLRHVRRVAALASAGAFLALVAWPALARAYTVTASPSDSAVTLGDEFYVRLSTDGSTDLRAYHLVYRYDPTRVQFLGATPGLLATGAGCGIAPYTQADYAAPADSVIFDVAMLGCSVNGAGELARFKFRAIGRGDAAVECQLVDFRNSLNAHTNPVCTGTLVHVPFEIVASATSGTITPAGVVAVNQGANQSFSYSPASACLSLTGVVVDGVPQTPVPASFTFTDVQANHTIAVTFADVTAPVLSASGTTLTLGCNPGAGELNAALGTATATDNCDTGLAPVAADGIVVSTGCGRSQTRNWNVSDAAGNAAVAVSRTVTWTEDTQAPVVTLAAAGALGCNPTPAQIAAAFGAAEVSDNCSTGLVATGVEGAETGSGCAFSTTKTWTATDACGNVGTATQTLAYTRDTQAPVVTLAAAGALGCNPTQAQIAAAFGAAEVSDNCSTGLAATGTVEAETGSGCAFSTTKNWTVTDACGNVGTATQTVSYTRDTQAPVVTLAAAGALGCNPTPAQIAAAFGAAEVSDNCSTGLVATGTVEAETSSGCVFSTTKNWSVSDACGNVGAATQTVSYTRDTQAPVVTLAAAGALGCNPTPAQIAAAFGAAEVSDNCSTGLVATGVEGVETGSGCTFSTTKTWTATDACGNVGAATQTLTYTRDTQAPVIAATGTTLALGCNPVPGDIEAALGSATATDNCGTVTPYAADGAVTIDGCTHSQTRTWNVSDACGNAAVAVARTVTWTVDLAPPVITLASVVTTVHCPAVPVFLPPTVADACDASPVLAFADVTTPGGSPGTYSVTRTWTATDHCGNASNMPQTIVVQDVSAPAVTLVGPASVTVECPAVYTEQGATANDACTGAVAVVITGAVDAHTLGVYTLTYTATDAAGNAASVNRTVTVVNNVAPVAATNLTATQVRSGNDADGTTKITIAYTPPTDGSTVRVYRKGYGNYPEYNDLPNAGSVPSYPSAGWELTGVTASGQADETGNRDFWYYVAVSEDPCGGRTASTLTSGTLNYFLGDVHNGGANCTGDNSVGTSDITFLGNNYGAHLADPGPDLRSCLDVGPTTSGSVDARPSTDNRIDFEDLVLFAINYGTVSQPSVARQAAATGTASTLSLSPGATPAVGETFDALLGFEGNGEVQGLSVQLAFDPAVVEPVSVTGGSLLAQQSGPAQVFTPEPGTLDAAVFGVGRTLVGTGELARMTFRVKTAGDPGIHLGDVRARDVANKPVTLLTRLAVAAQVLPARMELAPSYPNPFNHATTVVFGMPGTGHAKLAVFDIQGRTVRHLLDGTVEAGWTRLNWDGRNDDGMALAPGAYVIRLSSESRVITRSVRLVR